MKTDLGNTRLSFITLLLLIIGLAGSMACMAQEKAAAKAADKTASQDEFCTNWGNDRPTVSEIREYTVAGGGSLTVDGGTNGGISVIGEDRGDIFIRACVHAQGKTDEEAAAMAKSITINTGGTISASSSADGEKGWGVSYRIYVPRATNLKLNTHNGGIKISGVNSTMEFEALNGGIKLSDVAGNVRGRTTNGGVKIDLSGTSWKGGGLDVQTTNGGIVVSMADSYAAHFETGTVNGGFKSEIAGISAPEDRQNKYGAPKAVRISTDINGGGAPIRVITVNGGVKIVSAASKEKE